jgi:hypothetical protein
MAGQDAVARVGPEGIYRSVIQGILLEAIQLKHG